MRNRFDIGQDGRPESRTVRAIVASLCVLGLASLMWVHSGIPGQPDESAMAIPADGSSFLRVPTTDPSLPSLDATFARKGDADAEPAPTF